MPEDLDSTEEILLETAVKIVGFIPPIKAHKIYKYIF